MKKLLLFFIVLLPAIVHSQDHPKKSYLTTRIEKAPVINGSLDDEAWVQGNWEGDFWQYEPNEAAPPKQKTEFKILYDDDNIYVAFKIFDTAADSIVSRLTRRDDTDGDQIWIYFDSYYDQRTAFGFGVSVAGVKGDVMVADDGDTEDSSWDPIWFVKTSFQDWGWIAEMRIPLTELRFSGKEEQKWGMEILRNIYRLDETDLWQPIARNASGLVHNAGLLEGIKNIKPRKQLDIIPYGVAKYESYQGEPGNKWYDGSDIKANAGLDAKIGVSNNMIMSLSVNPDFGQVEADPSEVNLTAFESYFNEKRPFFIEGKNITNFDLGTGDGGPDNLFYSRRIGKKPKLSYSNGENEYSYTPAFTPILGAAKLTGKSENNWSLGAIEAITAQVNTRIYNTETRQESHVTAEPFTSYTVGRVQKDFADGKTIVGGMFTSTLRSLDDATEDYYNKTAITGGLDFTRYFDKMNYIFKIKMVFSNIQGTEDDIARTQRSAVHNFIRPDADYVEYDPTRTSLSGTGGNLMVGKIGGDLQLIYLSSWKSPGLELNDVGYMQMADRYLGVGAIQYRITKPFSVFNQMTFSANLIHLFDFGGNKLILAEALSVSAGFKNLWNSYLSVQVNSEERNNLLLRGGPSIKTPAMYYIGGGLDSNERKKLSGESNFSYVKGLENSASEFNLGAELNYRPFKALVLRAEPEWERSVNTMQYVATVPNLNGPDRYVFATIDQKTLSMSFRIDYNITPDLTVQYWGQPFFSAGVYNEFKRITDPEATLYTHRYHVFTAKEISSDAPDDLYNIDENHDGDTDYSFDNPNFNVSDFLSNLVIRWEFLPGSTAYLVWSQSREAYASDGIFRLNEQLNDVFIDNKPQNIFLIKLSYRFGLK